MKLLSATLRNYRIHRETSVRFDPFRTLIGGGNETGKSTLVEALHHGLFLKARVTGEVRSSMLPLRPAPAPEVEIDFESDGRRYRLAKRFSGASGSVRLAEEGGASWSGEEAEERLAALLGVSVLQRVTRDRLREQWSHLWVWQGQGMEDPSRGAFAEQDRLMQRLQEEGGAVVTQSEADSGVFRAVEERYLAFFTATGMPKAGSELKRSIEARDAAEERRLEAVAAHERLVGAIRGIEESEAVVGRLRQSDELLQKELQETETALAAVGQLEKEIVQAEHAVTLADAPLSAIASARTQVLALSEEIALLETSLEPGLAALAALKRRVGEEQAAFDADLEKPRLAAARKAEAERALEGMRARVELFAQEAAHGRLKVLRDQASGYTETIERLRNGVSELPAVDDAALGKLRRIVGDLERAEAALEAMASGLTLLEGDGSVRVGGKPLAEGESVLLDEATEIEAGNRFRFKVTPGGGNRLVEARMNAESARSALRDVLGRLGVASVDEAAEANARRLLLLGEIATAGAALKALDSDGRLGERFSSSARELEDARCAAERLPVPSAPASADEARKHVERARKLLEEADGAERAAREEQDDRLGLLQRLQGELGQAVEDSGERQRGLIEKRSQLDAILKQYGGETGIRDGLREAQEKKNGAVAQLDAHRGKLRDLQPEALRVNMERCRRALERNLEAQGEARLRSANFRALLERDGSDDPAGQLLSATERAERAGAYCDAVELRSRASRLLYDLYREEQAEDARRFSRPLAEKITGYLQAMFGPGVEASITYSGTSFGDIRIRRGGGESIGFAGLSGGMREQVSAAVRLSIAELLAEGYGGSLPVVFDDAFTNTDPERVRLLQRMLDRAASSGLQIIILSCHSEAYAGLGAAMQLLESGAGEERTGGDGR